MTDTRTRLSRGDQRRARGTPTARHGSDGRQGTAAQTTEHEETDDD